MRRRGIGLAAAVVVAALMTGGVRTVHAAGLSYVIQGRVLGSGTGPASVGGICVVAMATAEPYDPRLVWSTKTTAGGVYALKVDDYSGQGSVEPYYLSFVDCRPSPSYLTQYWQGATDSSQASPIGLGASSPVA